MDDAGFWREWVLRLVQQRGPEKSLCPSEVARQAAPTEWRSRMHAVRSAAQELADVGAIEFLQRGEIVDPRTARGAIRLRVRIQGSKPPATSGGQSANG